MLGYNWGNHYSYIALIGTLDWQCMHWLTSNLGTFLGLAVTLIWQPWGTYFKQGLK